MAGIIPSILHKNPCLHGSHHLPESSRISFPNLSRIFPEFPESFQTGIFQNLLESSRILRRIPGAFIPADTKLRNHHHHHHHQRIIIFTIKKKERKTNPPTASGGCGRGNSGPGGISGAFPSGDRVAFRALIPLDSTHSFNRFIDSFQIPENPFQIATSEPIVSINQSRPCPFNFNRFPIEILANVIAELIDDTSLSVSAIIITSSPIIHQSVSMIQSSASIQFSYLFNHFFFMNLLSRRTLDALIYFFFVTRQRWKLWKNIEESDGFACSRQRRRGRQLRLRNATLDLLWPPTIRFPSAAMNRVLL